MGWRSSSPGRRLCVTLNRVSLGRRVGYAQVVVALARHPPEGAYVQAGVSPIGASLWGSGTILDPILVTGRGLIRCQKRQITGGIAVAVARGRIETLVAG